MSKQPPKKPGDQKKKPFHFQPPPGLGFPMFPGFEELLKMPPMPGMEADYEMAMKTLESIANHDFTKPIDLENVCGHGGPGVEMKEGYCMSCYETENIAELVELLDLAEVFGPESAVQMMHAPSSSGASTSEPSTSAGPSTSAKSDGQGTSKSEDKPGKKPDNKEKKTSPKNK